MDYNPTVNFPFHCLEHLTGSLMIESSGLVMLSQIPDDLVDHYLAKNGFQCPDEGLVGISLQFYFILVRLALLSICEHWDFELLCFILFSYYYSVYILASLWLISLSTGLTEE